MISYMKEPYSDEETFKILCPLVREWFKDKFGEFSPPQKYSIMNIHNRENTLISSPTGSGKTLSAFTSILNELIKLAGKDQLENRVYAIYISPLKALANDIEKNLNTPLKEIKALAEKKVKGAGKKIDIRITIRTGDTTASKKSSMLEKTPHILITTPESFAIMLTSQKFRDKLKDVDWAVIDEIHAIAGSKRGTQLSLGLERLENLVTTKGQKFFTRIGLSATVSPLEKVAQFLVGMKDSQREEFRDCKIIDVQSIKKLDLKVLSPVPNLIESDYKRTHDEMYRLIDRLIQEHKTTLIFTNTRSATERVVHHLKEKFPQNYGAIVDQDEQEDEQPAQPGSESGKKANIFSKDVEEQLRKNRKFSASSNIGAHHSSLSKEHRLNIENRLKSGELKCVVSSTSLELGIDIGNVDLVILLGSPKSVARALQRIGRSGHKLHDVSKGRIIVLDRDDLVECSVLLKAAIERNIDKVNIPQNCLDVLAQELFGIAVEEPRHIDEIYKIVKSSYPFRNLSKKDYIEVIHYLNGQYATLEDRKVYAKIWLDEQTGMIGKKGKLARVLYMTNVGTIPDESFVKVKLQSQKALSDEGAYIGKIDEGFLERLKRGDVFVLGGDTYEYIYSQGMTAFVKSSVDRPPTVPSWVSETLPLSFDLALEIQKFRRYMNDHFENHASKEDIIKYINNYLYVDQYGANAIYEYFSEQHEFSKIPHEKKILIEHFTDNEKKYILFHTLYGRRVNDVLSRVMGFIISRLQHRDVEININDNGFYVLTTENIQAAKAFKLIKRDELRKIAEMSLDKTDVLGRRFRHCASRALMILRSYKGHRKTVSKQQLSSRVLINSVRRISEDFPILKEAKREVLEDLMDIKSTETVIEQIESGRIGIEEVDTGMPSPFAFNLITMGYTDIMKMEDKSAFLKRMHDMVKAKISLGKGRGIIARDKYERSSSQAFDYENFWNTQEMYEEMETQKHKERLKIQAWNLDLAYPLKEHIVEIIDGSKMIRQDLVAAIREYRQDIETNWPAELKDFILTRLIELGEIKENTQDQ